MPLSSSYFQTASSLKNLDDIAKSDYGLDRDTYIICGNMIPSDYQIKTLFQWYKNYVAENGHLSLHENIKNLDEILPEEFYWVKNMHSWV